MKWHQQELAQVQTTVFQQGGSRSNSLAPGMMGHLNAQEEVQKLQVEITRLKQELEAANNKEPQVIVDTSAVEAAERAKKSLKHELELAQAQTHKHEQTITRLENQQKETQQ